MTGARIAADGTTWQQRKAAALERAEYACQVCNSRNSLQVHHRTYERYGNERPADLTVLCAFCHVRFSKRRDSKIGQPPDCLEFKEHHKAALKAIWAKING